MELHKEIGNIYQQVQEGKLSKSQAADKIRSIRNTNGSKVSQVSDELLKSKTLKHLKSIIASELKMDFSALKNNASLDAYGLDSIMAMNITERLESDFGELSKTIFFEYQTIDELVGYFTNNFRSELVSVLGLQVAEASPKVSRITELPKHKATTKPLNKDLGDSRNQSPAGQPKEGSKEMAIIGVSGKYPKSNSIMEFWQNLKSGNDCVTEIPKERWDVDKYFHPERNREDTSYCKYGGFIDGVDYFDSGFFSISPKEAKHIDPQERIFLECAHSTLEDAGYRVDKNSKNVGVYVGVMYEEYQLYSAQENILGKHYSVSANPSSIANRVSYFFDFDGPSVAVDSMCSSSLVAIDMACKSIANGDCEVALAGGVNITIHPNKYILLSQTNMLSEKGRCASFGDGGDGYVPSEGVGAVLIKEKAKAIEDGDHIYAVIKGSAVNHGGKAKSYTAPNPESQAKVIAKALKNANIDPRTVSYVEAHGTGTALGDPIEIDGLERAFAIDSDDANHCAVGSVKSNIGHCESAAGIAALTKVLLQFKYQTLVPSIHSDALNEYIDFDRSHFKVQRSLQHWDKPKLNLDGAGETEYPRIAGISSFGAGGTNAHILLEEFAATDQVAPIEERHEYVIPFSAKSKTILDRYVTNTLHYIREQGVQSFELSRIAYTLQVGRQHFSERLVVTASSVEQFVELLERYLQGDTSSNDISLGKSNTEGELTELLQSDGALEALIQSWLQDGAYQKLIEVWIKGFDVDWSQLYENNRPQKLSLPTYPFEKESHWLNNRHIEQGGNVIANRTPDLHPLIHQNTSTLESQKFTSTFSGEEAVFKDHIVNQEKVLPGAAYIEMVVAAFKLSTSQDLGTLSLKNIQWLQPFKVGGSTSELHLSITPKDKDSYRFEFYSDRAGINSLFCAGDIATRTEDTAGFPAVSSFSSGRVSQVLSADEIYARYKSFGFDYGPSHKAIQKIEISDNLVRALLSVDSGLADSQYCINPGMLDSAIQTCAAYMLGESETNLKLPFGIDEVLILSDLANNAEVYIKEGESTSSDMSKKDVYIFSEDHKPLLSLKGLTFRALIESQSAFIEPGSVAASEMILNPDWELVDDHDKLQENTSDINATVKVFLLGERVSSTNINANNTDAIEIRSDKASRIDKFFDYSLRLADEIKSLINQAGNARVNAQILVPANLEFEAFSAFIQSVMLETPTFRGQVVVYEDVDDLSKTAAAWQWANFPLLKIDAQGLSKRTVSQTEISVKQDSLAYKDGGVYLITGGAGGIGALVAQSIVKRAKGATIVLTGRSKTNQHIDELLSALSGEGNELIYRTMDVTQYDEVLSVVQDIQSSKGTIDGIIHSAGVINDKYLANKDSEEIQSVLAPKVFGTHFLDKASRDINLDWFVTFSSVSGVFGNEGQADYALASAFMDYFSINRSSLVLAGERSGHSLSINWPFWQDGGMRISEHKLDITERSSGLKPLPTSIGTRILEDLLSSGLNNAVVLYGDTKRLAARLAEQDVSDVRQDVPRKQENLSKAFIEKTEKYFAAEITSFLEVKKTVDIDANFESYGLDSVMIMQLLAKLEANFGSLPKTLFFEHHNVRELASYMAVEHKAKLIEILDFDDEPNSQSESTVPVEARSSAANRIAGSRQALMDTSSAPRLPELTSQDSNAIAVVAMAGRYPGANSIDEFWQNLREGKSSITTVPESRWRQDGQDRYLGGFIDGIDQFDPLFFRISPKEASVLDPQERLFLENTWCLLENGAYSTERIRDLAADKVGVFVGAMSNQYAFVTSSEHEINAVRTTAVFHSIANRVSQYFDFKGPSLAIDSACSSGLTSIHLACKSLINQECHLAVAGAVNLSLIPEKYQGLGVLGLLGEDENSISFGNGQGYLPSEGVGSVLLKRLDDAKRDGDSIIGVIKSTHINHSGRSTGYSIPNPKQQSALIEENAQRAGVPLESIAYAELAVNGSALGDPIEIAGLRSAFSNINNKDYSCSIGSVKSNIGHGEAVSGIAQITKVLLQLKNQELAPSVPSADPNPAISLDGTPFEILTNSKPWDASTGPRRAMINSFGAGGAYANAIVEEYIASTDYVDYQQEQEQLFCLSAKDQQGLARLAANMRDFLDKNRSKLSLSSVCKTLQLGRSAMGCRLSFVTGNISDAIEKLDDYVRICSNSEDASLGDELFFSRNDSAIEEFKELLSGDEGDIYLARLVSDRKLSKLALLWVNSAFDSWQGLFGEDYDQLPFTVLPNYPFKKQRCWVETVERSVAALPEEAAHSDAPGEVELSHEQTGQQQTGQEQPNQVALSQTGEIENEIATLLEKELELEKGEFSNNDYFQDIGLHSMSGMKIQKEIEHKFGVSLSSRDFLEHPTVNRLSMHIRSKIDSDTQTTMPEQSQEEEQQQTLLSLSEGQKGLWMLQKSEPESSVYNVPLALKISQGSNLELLEQACRLLLDIHPILGCTIVEEDGIPYMKSGHSKAFQFDVREESTETLTTSYLKELSKIPFSLEKNLIRFTLLRSGDGDHYLLIVVHHVIFDGASSVILAKDLVDAYAKLVNGVHVLPNKNDRIEYFNHVEQEKSLLSSQSGEQLKSFWVNNLSGSLPVLELPTDFVRSQENVRQGSTSVFPLGKQLSDDIHAFARLNHVKPIAIFLALYKILVYRYTDEKDLIVGMPTIGRSSNSAANAIGYYVNMVALRTELAEDLVPVDLFNSLQYTIADAMDNSAYPFSSVVKALNVPRSNISPVFQIAFAFQNFMEGELPESLNINDVHKVSVVEGIQQEGEYELLLEVYEYQDGFRITLNYDKNLYSEQTIERMFGHYRTLLESVLADSSVTVGDLTLLPQNEYELLVNEWNDTELSYDKAQLLHQGFESQVDHQPDSVALICDGKDMTYAQLEEKSNQLANYIQATTVISPETKIAVCCYRSFDMIIAVLAILKSGAAYVPLDPDSPKERLEYICESAGASLIISHDRFADKLSELAVSLINYDLEINTIDKQSRARPTISTHSSDLAYIIYTSGSTGKPKGVKISHYSVSNLIEWVEREYQVNQTDRVLFVTSLCFDLSVYDIFGLLSAGASIHIAQEHELKDLDRLAQLLAEGDITFWDSAPGALRQLEPYLDPAKAIGKQSKLRLIFMSGDWIPLTLPPKLWQAFPGVKVVSLGGATEATVWSNYYNFDDINPNWISIPYGKPIQNSQYYVLDTRLQPCPIGIPGNLYIGGDCLARGYTDEDITRERFIPNPIDPDKSETLYFTGDRARFFADGNIEFLGRIDHQVKLRGYRVELGEVESVVAQHESVRECTSIVREDEPGKQLLVVYVIPNKGDEICIDALKTLAAEKLPHYMVPSAFVTLEQFPVTVNGKLDRKALPAPSYENFQTSEYEEADSENERILSEIWKEVLSLDKVGRNDNFFEIGGDSLIAMQVLSKSAEQGLNYSIRTIFENPTIRMLAVAEPSDQSSVADQDKVTGEVPLTPAQHWFFEKQFTDSDDWSQCLAVYVPKDIGADTLKESLQALIEHHDILRSSYTVQRDGSVAQDILPTADVSFRSIELENDQSFNDHIASINAQADLAKGRSVCAIHLIDNDAALDKLLLSVHHLVVDAVSWNILVEDITNYCRAVSQGETFSPPRKTTSFQYWAERLQLHAESNELQQEADFWSSLLHEPEYTQVLENVEAQVNLESKASQLHLKVDEELTSELLDTLPAKYQAKDDDILLSALGMALGQWKTLDKANWLVMVEGHGREALFEEVDLSRTVGWFTTFTPQKVLFDESLSVAQMIATNVGSRAEPSFSGLGYGVLKYLAMDNKLPSEGSAQPQISFNYLGRISENKMEAKEYTLVDGSFDVVRSPNAQRPYLLELDLIRLQDELLITVKFCEDIVSREKIEALLQELQIALQLIVRGDSNRSFLELAKNKNDFLPEPQLAVNESEQTAVSVDLHEHNSSGEFVPLSGLQLAYKIGEKSFFGLDGIVAHEYFEVEYSNLNLDNYINAWRKLIDRHEALRCFVTEENGLEVLDDVPEYSPVFVEYQHLSEEEKNHQLDSYRKRLKEVGPNTDQWPLFELTVHQYDDSKIIIHLNIAIILIDGLSFQLLFQELSHLYHNPQFQPEQTTLSLKDYSSKVEEFKRSKEYVLSKLYWKKRTPLLPDAPMLPVAASSSGIRSNLSISNMSLGSTDWLRIKEIAKTKQLTPSSVLLTVFAKVLSKWSGTEEFIFSILHANRYPVHPDANKLFGNFSTTNIFEVDFVTNETFVDSAIRFQRRLQSDLENYFYSGVEVLADRNTSKKQLHSEVPIAFSDTTVFDESGDASDFQIDSSEKVNFSGSQTPHVYLDCILHVQDGGVNLRWSYQPQILPIELIEDMQQANIAMLQQLANDESCWDNSLQIDLSAEQLQSRTQANATQSDFGTHYLHSLFASSVRSYPNNTAIVSSQTRLSYQELNELSNRIAARLKSLGVGRNELVAIVMHKGWEQVTAALAILFAGGAYMPVDASYPEERVNELLDTGEVNVVLTQKDVLDSCNWPQQVTPLVVDMDSFNDDSAANHEIVQSVDDLAYVIFTSGSTGKPKGVMIDHTGAANTILDINQRFSVTQNDRVLAISSLSFDLSVYDIFGTLAAGGTLVIPDRDDHRDPKKLLDWVEQEKVTLWNSVPAFVQMFQEYIDADDAARISSLRTIMMSGDWIPLSLPEKLLTVVPDAQIFSLGGATEASIWSILYPIQRVESDWKSIPYGKPMANQTFEVLDQELQPCPLGVPGELYIGGIGVAKGYWKDSDRTNQSFIQHPSDGRRLYRTGDLGRYMVDGNIEFLGRIDNQVKIQGYRVELGEIETVLKKHSGIKDCLVADKEINTGEKQLVAYFIKEPEADHLDNLVRDLEQYLRRLLPSYMVPAHFVEIDQIPVTQNGKVNKKALPLPLVSINKQEFEAPQNAIQIEVSEILKDILSVDSLSINDSFFDLGGHSISAVRLISAINKKYHREFPVSVLAEYDTVRAIASLLEQGKDVSFSLLVELNSSGDKSPFFCIHPIGGHIMSYQDLSKHLLDHPFIGIQAPGVVGQTGDFSTVEKMASEYITLMKQKQQEGPYFIGGWSFGGIIAYEMVCQLIASGDEISQLVLLDSYVPSMVDGYNPDEGELFANFVIDLNGRFENLSLELDQLHTGSIEERQHDLLSKLKQASVVPEEMEHYQLKLLFDVYKNNMIAMHTYSVKKLDVNATLVKADNRHLDVFSSYSMAQDSTLGWSQYINLDVVNVEGDHYSMFYEKNARLLAEHIRDSYWTPSNTAKAV